MKQHMGNVWEANVYSPAKSIYSSQLFVRIFALLLFSSLLQPLQAAETRTPTKGSSYFAKKAYQKAVVELEKAFINHPSDPVINFQLGRSYYEIGSYDRALMTYERMLIFNPNQPRIKFELGRTLLMLQRYKEAEEYLNTVLESPAPPAVKSEVKSVLASLERGLQKHHWSGSLSLSGSYDSNITVSSQDDVLDNAQHTVKAQDGFFGGQTLMCNHSYRVSKSGNTLWDTHFVSYNDWYDQKTTTADLDEQGLNINYLSLSTGPTFYDDDLKLELNAHSSYMYQGGVSYFRTIGGETTCTLKLDEGILYLTTLRLDKRDYTTEPDYNGWHTSSSHTLFLMSGKSVFQIRAGYDYNNADADEYTYHRVKLAAKYIYQLPWRMSCYSGWHYENKVYRTSSDNSDLRKDQVHELSCGIRKKLGESWQIELAYKYRKTFSSLKVYRYNRHQSTLSVKYSF